MQPEDQAALAKLGIAAGGAAASGLTLNEWVAIITIIYVLLQIGLLVPKYWRSLSQWFRGMK